MREILSCRDIGALLRFVNRRGWSRSAIVAATGMTETAVRECWNGRRRVVSYEVLERIADGLGVPRGLMGLSYADETAIRATPIISRPVISSEDYMTLVAGLSVGVTAFPGPMSNNLSAERLSDPTTMRHVELIRDITDLHRRYDAEFGGGACRDSASAYLLWAKGMQKSRCASDDVGRALTSALSDLHLVVGWAHHDLGEHATARDLLVDALTLARKVNDLPLMVGALYRLGRVSIHQNRPSEALKTWQLGQIAAQESGSLLSVALLHANEAWAYAQLGDDLRVRNALARAESERDRASGSPVPAWARFFTKPADLSGMSGLVYTTLATHPEHRKRYVDLALYACESSLQHRQPDEGRSRVLDMIGLAGAHLLDGDMDTALRYGFLAADASAAIDSQRAIDRLRDVVDLGDQLGAAADLAELSACVEALAVRSL